MILEPLRLHAFNPDMTYITSFRNVVSIEHTAISVLVAFGKFCLLEKGRIFLRFS